MSLRDDVADVLADVQLAVKDPSRYGENAFTIARALTDVVAKIVDAVAPAPAGEADPLHAVAPDTRASRPQRGPVLRTLS